MAVLIVDNYDSFTYNLFHYVDMLAHEPVHVVYNDKISAEQTDSYETIIFSPGPGLPKNAGNMPAILSRQIRRKKVLGVCLGHQAIGEFFGAKLNNKQRVHHGVASLMRQTADSFLWKDIPATFDAGRYHSWALDRQNFPKELIITAEDEDGEIMAIKHQHLPVFGVQFHPESIMTPQGRQIIKNFLQI
jgi:anthranilate synthase/aminodeoxychorismate synthase-like glutamine amidotransferase